MTEEYKQDRQTDKTEGGRQDRVRQKEADRQEKADRQDRQADKTCREDRWGQTSQRQTRQMGTDKTEADKTDGDRQDRSR